MYLNNKQNYSKLNTLRRLVRNHNEFYLSNKCMKIITCYLSKSKSEQE